MICIFNEIKNQKIMKKQSFFYDVVIDNGEREVAVYLTEEELEPAVVVSHSDLEEYLGAQGELDVILPVYRGFSIDREEKIDEITFSQWIAQNPEREIARWAIRAWRWVQEKSLEKSI